MEEPKDILSFLVSLDDKLLQSLYEDEFCVLTVFRSLRGLAKQYVMNMICMENAVLQKWLDQWIVSNNTAKSHHKAAIHKLREMRILLRHETSTDYFYINYSFKHCLTRVLLGGSSCQWLCHRQPESSSSSSSSSSLLSSTTYVPTKEKLDKHAKDRWEQILNTLVDSKASTLSILLSKVNLMRQSHTQSYEITGEGFRFLFQDIHSQIWQIVIGYLRDCKSRNLQEEEVLKFLFRLSFLTPDRSYSCDNLTQTQTVLVGDFHHFGLVFQKKKTNVFYPTYLSKHLSVGHSLTKKERDSRGFIIVETTFKIYAYSNSDLQIGLLSKFARIEVRLPNMVSGKITKNSIMEAIQKGIPVDMIIDYLEEYAHPLMRNKYPILPINVMDQMRLWESETKRLHMEEAVLIYSIPTTQMFENFVRVVTARSVDERAALLAEKGGPDSIQEIIRSIDQFVNDCEYIETKESENQNINSNKNTKLEESPEKLSELIDKITFYIKEMESLQQTDFILLGRYQLIFKKYGWDTKALEFTSKKLTVNDIIQMGDDLLAIHFPNLNHDLLRSHLLWSKVEDQSIVVTQKGRAILKEYMISQNRTISTTTTTNKSS